MSPQRIQLRRTKGWRKPEGAVVVSRPSKWGNPLTEKDEGLAEFLLARTETVCNRCKGPNVSWCAPSPLWNQVMRGGSIDGEWQYGEIICPTCFAVLAEEVGIARQWRLYPTDVHVELETITPSGRVWNPDTWLWEATKDD